MRSPVIAFGLFAAAAVSPTLVSAAPASPSQMAEIAKVAAANAQTIRPTHVSRSLGGVEQTIPHPSDLNVESPSANHQHAATKKKHEHKSSKPKRALDGNTAGGNAYSGGTSDATGGSIVNESNSGDGDTITNETASMFNILYI